MENTHNLLTLPQKILLKILVHVPNLNSSNYMLINKKLNRLIGKIFIHYDKKFTKLYSDWANEIEILVKKLVKREYMNDIYFLINNYSQSKDIIEYLNFYAGYYEKINIVPRHLLNYQEIAEGAAARNNLALIEKINAKLNYNKLILYGAYYGYLDLVKYFLKKGANNINEVAYDASRFDHLNVVEYAFDHGADNYLTCAKIAALNGNDNVVKYLMKYVEDDAETIASAAAKGNHLKIVIDALKNQPIGIVENTALTFALYGYLDSLEYLVANYGVSNFRMIGMFGAIGGHKNVVDYAIENGAKNYVEMAREAAQYGHKELLLYLLTFIHKIEDLESIANYAAYNGNIELMEIMIDKGVNSYDQMAITAADSGKLNAIKFLIKKGAKDYYYIASHAVMNEYINILEYLIKKNKLSVVDIEKLAILAAENNYLNIVKYLINHGAKNYQDIIRIAKANDNEDIVKYVNNKEIGVGELTKRFKKLSIK